MKIFTDKMAQSTGINPEDIEEIPDDFSHQQVEVTGGPVVLAEVLVQRLCVTALEEEEEKDGKKYKKIVRRARHQSYNIFHGRKVSDGLFLADMMGKKISLQLPSSDTVTTMGLGEPPSLFLPLNDGMSEFFSFLRTEGLTIQGKHHDLSNMPPLKLSDPLTMLSKFIIVDVQSKRDLGTVGENDRVLAHIGEAYSNGPAQFLWEPKGFYDRVEGWATHSKTKMVSADDLFTMGNKAAQENSHNTKYCDPTFSRSDLLGRRDSENCMRYTELAIPRGEGVTILGRPVKNASGDIELVPPNSAENGLSESNPDAERFRFRILKGHTVEQLIKQRSLNIMMYYGMGVLGELMVLWGCAGCPPGQSFGVVLEGSKR